MLVLCAVIATLLLLFAFGRQIVLRGHVDSVQRITPVMGSCVLPKAAVVVAAGEVDSELEQCIEAILKQDHANFELHVVTQQESETVLSILSRIAAEQRGDDILKDRMHVHQMQHQPEIARECSALLLASSAMSEDVQHIAVLNSTRPLEADWLRRIVSPLLDENQPVATAPVWFLPTDRRPGTTLRAIVNGNTSAHLLTSGVPSQDCIAISAAFIEAHGLRDIWKTAPSIESGISNALREKHVRMAIVGELTSLDPSSCTVSDACRFATRQMFRMIHHSGRTMMSLFVVLSGLIQLVAIALLIGSCVTREWLSASLMGVAMVIQLFVLTGGWLRQHREICETFPDQSSGMQPTGFPLAAGVTLASRLLIVPSVLAALMQRKNGSAFQSEEADRNVTPAARTHGQPASSDLDPDALPNPSK